MAYVRFGFTYCPPHLSNRAQYELERRHPLRQR